MKLIFSKEDGNLTVKIATGTVEEDFDYVKMIKGLLEHNKFDDTVYDESVSPEEKGKIEAMLDNINDSIETE